MIRDFKQTGNPEEIRVCCPRCGDTKYHLYINIRLKLFHCFRCNYSGKYKEDLIDEVLLLKTKKEVKKEQKSYLRIPIFNVKGTYLWKGIENVWYKRGFTLEDAKNYGILVNLNLCSLSIPVYDENQQIAFYVERFLYPKDLKYLYPSNIKVSNFLYNFNRINGDFVILTEGVFDALAINVSFKKDVAVALFGKNLSETQMSFLVKKNGINKIFICLDRDALKESLIIQNKLMPFKETKIIFFDFEKDPADFMKNKGREILKNFLIKEVNYAN